MGNFPEAGRKVLETGTSVEASHTEDVFLFLPISTGEAIRVKVSIEVHCEESLEDKRCNMLIDLEEAIHSTMVGGYRFLKKKHTKEYHGTVRYSRLGFVEES